MRTSATWMMFGLCGVLATTACASIKKLEKQAEANVPGLKKEINAIKKGDVSTISGPALTVAVNNALSKDAGTKDAKIDVEVKGTVVHLKGTVTAEQKTHAEKIAGDVTGVTKVVNELKASGAKTAAKDDDGKAGHAIASKDVKATKDTKDTKASKDVKAPGKASKPTRASGK